VSIAMILPPARRGPGGGEGDKKRGGIEKMTKLSREEVLEIVRVAREKGERPDLRGPDLRAVNLSAADLSGVDLRGVDLIGANFVSTNLSKADLSEAHLGEVNLSIANLSGANLIRTNLIGANLSGANLSGADLSEAVISQTIFGDVDLSEVKGLKTVQHWGRSTIGADTLLRSKHIPDVFLYKAGVPESPCTLEELNELIADLQKRLTIIRRNLGDRKEVQALHGPLNSPLSLNNEIRELEKEQETIETQMAEYRHLRTLYYPSSQAPQ
jgi:hypothetical protein